MNNPDPFGIALAVKLPGTPIEKSGGALLMYALRGPNWFPYEAQPIGSRNALVAGIGNGLFDELEHLRALGFVAQGERTQTEVMFHVTDGGLWVMRVSREDRLRVVKTTRRYRRGKAIFQYSLDHYKTDWWLDNHVGGDA